MSSILNNAVIIGQEFNNTLLFGEHILDEKVNRNL